MSGAGGSRVQVCGPVRVRVADRDVPVAAGQPRILLAYLVLNRHRAVERTILPDVLWGDAAPPSAERTVAVLLSRIRAGLGPDVLTSRGDLQLRLPEPAQVDIEIAREAVHRSDAAIAAADWTTAWTVARVALAIAQREFLPAVDRPWVALERERLRDIRFRAWEGVGEAGLGLGGAELVSSRRAGRELMAMEPLRESGYRLSMRASIAAGNPAEALHTYERLRRRLADELGVDPGQESRALFEQVLASTTAG